MFILLCCMGTTAVMAQTLKKKDLIGSWKSVTYYDEDVTIDLATGKRTYAADFKDTYTSDEIMEIEAEFDGIIELYKDNTLVFEDMTLTNTSEDEEFGGVYSIVQKDGQDIMTVITDEGTEYFFIYIKDNLLHISPDGYAELIYKRK